MTPLGIPASDRTSIVSAQSVTRLNLAAHIGLPASFYAVEFTLMQNTLPMSLWQTLPGS